MKKLLLLLPALALLGFGCAPTPTQVDLPPADDAPTFEDDTEVNNGVPMITVTSPNGGETFTEGDTVEITWISANVTTIAIEVATGGKPLGILTEGVPASDGSFTWVIPDDLISSFGSERSDVMKVLVVDANLPFIADFNDSDFTLLAN